MVGTVTASAQHALENGKPYQVYCDIMGYNAMGIGKLKVVLDIGDSSKEYCSLFDETGKKIKFNSMIEVVDYMSKHNWTLHSTCAVQNVIHFLMVKTVTDDSQITEGLIVRKDGDDKK